MTARCPTCNTEMKALLTSVYCPNEERHAQQVGPIRIGNGEWRIDAISWPKKAP
jgi:hypothetical protein